MMHFHKAEFLLERFGMRVVSNDDLLFLEMLVLELDMINKILLAVVAFFLGCIIIVIHGVLIPNKPIPRLLVPRHFATTRRLLHHHGWPWLDPLVQNGSFKGGVPESWRLNLGGEIHCVVCDIVGLDVSSWGALSSAVCHKERMRLVP